jgi:hypothetical protein
MEKLLVRDVEQEQVSIFLIFASFLAPDCMLLLPRILLACFHLLLFVMRVMRTFDAQFA